MKSIVIKKNMPQIKSPQHNIEKVETLIEKYFEGITSLEEEQWLRNYFQNEDIPEAMQTYQPIFQFFSEEKNAATTKTIPLPVGKRRHRNIRWFSVAAAASLLLLFSLKPIFEAHRLSPERSLAYINGKKHTNIELIQAEVLKALDNVSAANDDVYSSQIEALDFFLDAN
jgi:hypothetical protein